MIENFVINNSNNVGLDTFVEYPDEKNNERLAVLCPGYLDSKDYPHLVALSNALTKEGFTVARFDPSGTWMSGGTIADYSITQYLKDLKSVIDYLCSKERFNRLVLCGHSLGGLVSLVYATRDSRVSEVVAIMTPYAFIRPSNFNTKGDDSMWKINGYKLSTRDAINASDEKKEFKVPYSMAEDSKRFSTIDAVRSINSEKVSVVFIVGEADTVVPIEDTECIFGAANQPKKFISIKNVGHDYRHSAIDIEKVNKEIIAAINIPLFGRK